MKKLSKKISVLFLTVLTVGMLWSMEGSAAGGSSSLGVSSSTVNIGDTVTVTMNVSADAYAAFRMSVTYDAGVLEYTGASSNDCNGGGGALSVVSEVNGSYSISFNFRAVAPGTASVSASAVEAFAVETAEAMSISGSGASVTVNNAASDGGGTVDEGTAGGDTSNGGNASNDGGTSNGGDTSNGGGTSNGGDTSNDGGNANGGDASNQTGEEQPSLSGDNSLQSLTISPGKLSPEFKYSTTKYTATVASDVTSVAVDAKVSNSKATVESVTGNTNLQMGENTIKIVVKAENGTLAVYKITVTRGGEEAPVENETDEPQEIPEELPDDGIVINGKSYEVVANLPEDELPEEFTKKTITYKDEEVEIYTFPYGDLQLFYLKPVLGEEEEETGENQGKFFFYNATTNEFFPHININVGQKYVLLLSNTYAETVPVKALEAEITIGDNVIKGYQIVGENGNIGGEFYLVYGVDKNGTAGWYQYDSIDMSLQRYNESLLSLEGTQEEVQEEIVQVEGSALEQSFTELEEKYQKEKSNSRIIMAVLIFLLVVAIIVIIDILIFGFKGSKKNGIGKNEDMDYIDFDAL